MIEIKKAATCLLLLALLSGCATQPKNLQPFQPEAIPEGWGAIYLYREWAFVSGGWFPLAYINGMEIHPVRNGSYQMILVPPGKHNLRIGQPDFGPGLDIEVTAGTHRYVAFAVQLNAVIPVGTGVITSAGSGIWIVEPVEAHRAMTPLDDSEMLNLKRLYKDCKKSSSYSPTATDCDSFKEQSDLVGPYVFREPAIQLEDRYRVQIDRNGSQFFKGQGHRDFELQIEQLGYIVRARNESLGIEIEGIIDGNTIEFVMAEGSKVANAVIRGSWLLDSGSSPITGSWNGGSGQTASNGEWNLVGGYRVTIDEDAIALQERVRPRGPFKLD